jgi:hypothetical protein
MTKRKPLSEFGITPQTPVKRYTAGLHPINVLALTTNALFILLHFVQTHIWYDGLAQDASIRCTAWASRKPRWILFALYAGAAVAVYNWRG